MGQSFLHLGRVTKEEGVNLARRREGSDGELRGLLVVSLFPALFSQIQRPMAHPGGAGRA